MTEQTTVDMDLVTRWIEALESGEYAQTQERLKDANGYCCLGVLCDIADPTKWNEYDCYETGLPNDVIDSSGGEADTMLPTSIARRVGIDEEGVRPGRTPWFPTGNINSLASLNDTGVSFDQIAAALREHYDIPKHEVQR